MTEVGSQRSEIRGQREEGTTWNLGPLNPQLLKCLVPSNNSYVGTEKYTKKQGKQDGN